VEKSRSDNSRQRDAYKELGRYSRRAFTAIHLRIGNELVGDPRAMDGPAFLATTGCLLYLETLVRGDLNKREAKTGKYELHYITVLVHRYCGIILAMGAIVSFRL
jgi:hypothetical protein